MANDVRRACTFLFHEQKCVTVYAGGIVYIWCDVGGLATDLGVCETDRAQMTAILLKKCKELYS